MEILIPIAGVAAVAWLIYASSGKQKAASGPFEKVTRVDLPSLIGGSSINRTVSMSTIPRTTGEERTRNSLESATMWLEGGTYGSRRLRPVPMGVALAAIINADYESRTSNKATGDNGKAVGLYQIGPTSRGGFTESQLRTAAGNTARMMELYSGRSSRIEGAYQVGATVAELAGIFGKYVERSANPNVLTKRADYARKLFPSIADLPAKALT